MSCNLRVKCSVADNIWKLEGDGGAFGGLEHLQEAIRRVMGFLRNDFLVIGGSFVAENCF